jgi:hypothetical protein
MTLYPLDANEVARRVPLAAARVGWSCLEAQADETRGRRFEVHTGGAAPLQGAVVVERRETFWTAIRLSWSLDSPATPRDCQRFLRSVVVLADCGDGHR